MQAWKPSSPCNNTSSKTSLWLKRLQKKHESMKTTNRHQDFIITMWRKTLKKTCKYAHNNRLLPNIMMITKILIIQPQNVIKWWPRSPIHPQIITTTKEWSNYVYPVIHAYYKWKLWIKINISKIMYPVIHTYCICGWSDEKLFSRLGTIVKRFEFCFTIKHSLCFSCSPIASFSN